MKIVTAADRVSIWRVATADGFLPIEQGLYYRFHHKNAPFGPEYATSKNIGDPLEGLSSDFKKKYWSPRPGYSAFWHPDHLYQYLDSAGWLNADDTKDRQVIAFRGVPVGEGGDGEPRVMPLSNKPEAVYSLQEFMDRKPDAGDRWDDHTWGEGPDGQIVDDGYRTLGGRS